MLQVISLVVWTFLNAKVIVSQNESTRKSPCHVFFHTVNYLAALPTDCGASAPTSWLILRDQSDIDAIANCTTIYSNLRIILNSPDNGWPAPPTAFNLPSGLQALDRELNICMSGGFPPTTSISAPGLISIGANLTPSASDFNALFSGFSINIEGFGDFSVTSTLFPLLQNVYGNFVYNVNSDVTEVEGFPALKFVADDLNISGSFRDISLPNLTTVDGPITIQSGSESFQCPLNILKIVNTSADNSCGLSLSAELSHSGAQTAKSIG
jgi:hypothetical protein